MSEVAEAVTGEWRKLSAWSIVHFAARAVMQNVQAALGVGAGAYGVSQTEFGRFTWLIPAVIGVLIVVGSAVSYLFYRFCVTEDSVQVRRGALFKRHLNLAFERIQNISLEHPFYFRPLGLVTLRIDGAGGAGEEVQLAALGRLEAESIRTYIVNRRRDLSIAPGAAEAGPGDDAEAETEGLFFTRSLPDLVIHGLTNNRAFLAVAGIVGVLSQTNLELDEIVEPWIARLGAMVGSFGLVRIAVLFVIAFVLITGLLALLSVIVSIVTYYGFSVYRTRSGLTVKRGLLTKHEINVRKSRIQTVTFRQDWLDYLLGRRNIVLEQITHASPQAPQAAAGKRILVPSVRLDETDTLMEEVLPGCRVDELDYTPIRKPWFYKHAIIHTALHALLLIPALAVPNMPALFLPAVLLLWPPHVALVYMRWKRAGIAVDGELVAARSGIVGVNYQVFPAFKAQDVSHIQSVLMRRRDLSTLAFHTASSTVTVPYLTTGFAKRIANYCLFRVEATERSWM